MDMCFTERLLYTEDPARGQRRMRHALRKQFGIYAGRLKIRRLMNVLGIAAIYPKRNFAMADKLHKKYPYLLRNVAVTRVNQVWSTDITYIKLNGGFVPRCLNRRWKNMARRRY